MAQKTALHLLLIAPYARIPHLTNLKNACIIYPTEWGDRAVLCRKVLP